MEGSPVCLSTLHIRPCHSLPNKITRSFWLLPRAAAILAFTAETWLSLSASMWKSSSKKLGLLWINKTCLLPTNVTIHLCLNGWALKGQFFFHQQRELESRRTSLLKVRHQQILNTTMEADCDVSVEKKFTALLTIHYLEIFPFLSLTAHMFFPLFLGDTSKITTHHPSPSHKCWKTSPSNLQLHFQQLPRFSPPLSVPLVGFVAPWR